MVKTYERGRQALHTKSDDSLIVHGQEDPQGVVCNFRTADKVGVLQVGGVRCDFTQHAIVKSG